MKQKIKISIAAFLLGLQASVLVMAALIVGGPREGVAALVLFLGIAIAMYALVRVYTGDRSEG